MSVFYIILVDSERIFGKIGWMNKFANKQLIVFDLDGTLAPSKSIADKEMVGLLLSMLEKKKVAVIGGGKYSLFQRQLLAQLPKRDPRLTNFFFIPNDINRFLSLQQWLEKSVCT